MKPKRASKACKGLERLIPKLAGKRQPRPREQSVTTSSIEQETTPTRIDFADLNAFRQRTAPSRVFLLQLPRHLPSPSPRRSSGTRLLLRRRKRQNAAAGTEKEEERKEEGEDEDEALAKRFQYGDDPIARAGRAVERAMAGGAARAASAGGGPVCRQTCPWSARCSPRAAIRS